MQIREQIPIRNDGIILQYEGEEVYSISNEVYGDFQEIHLTREELYDICQIVFARQEVVKRA